MNIIVAKTSGFCFGVSRAVSTVNKLIDDGKKVCTLGEIIHNPYVVNDLKNRGVMVVNSPSEVPEGYTLVVRSHGCTKSDMDFILNSKIPFVDATCPFVKKIHKIVETNEQNKKILLAAGDAEHPEMIGIRSYFSGKSYVFKDKSELENIIKQNKIANTESILLVSQTTFSKSTWKICTKFIKDVFTNVCLCDTICNTTNLRQQEAEILSKNSDLMVVIGGKKSSNTLKLYEICQKNAPTLLVEFENDLPIKIDKKYSKIGIVAGASTPPELVQKIKNTLEMIYYGNQSS